MRICSPAIGLSPVSNLGGEVYEREILKGLARLGTVIEIPLVAGPVEEVENWRVHRMPRRRGYRYFSMLYFLQAMWQIWRERPFDLIRAHETFLIGPAAVTFGRLTRVPVVAHYHHLGDAWVQDRWIRERVDALLSPRYDAVITISEFSRQQVIQQLKVSPDRVFWTYVGVPPEFRPACRSLALTERYHLDGCRVLLFLSALKPRKNPLLAVEVFARLALQHPDLALVMAGGGSLEPELRHRVQVLGLESRVIFTGFVPEEEKVAHFNLADVFLFPSRMEGFGMVAAQAMACGVPVVASNVGGIPEVVLNGRTGFLAAPADVEDFAAKIDCLLRNAELSRRMGQAGREWVTSQFSWDRAARQVLAVYEDLIDRCR